MEQLAYCETRCECLRNLSAKIEIQAGITISDKMRFCKGDGPAVELECGQQRGGGGGGISTVQGVLSMPMGSTS